MFPVLLNRTKPFSGGAGGESPHVNGSEFNFITSMDCNFELSMTGSVEQSKEKVPTSQNIGDHAHTDDGQTSQAHQAEDGQT